MGKPRKVQQTEARTGDEGARLGALRDVGLLDAEPDPALERLTRLAGELLGVPISLVSLVDAGRQYFAGATGLSVPSRRRPRSRTRAAGTSWSGARPRG